MKQRTPKETTMEDSVTRSEVMEDSVMEVAVVFRFKGIKDANSPEADEVMEHMSALTKEWMQNDVCTDCYVSEAICTTNKGE